MLMALLLALGVDLVVVVVFAMLVFGRRRWLKRKAGEFAGRIRVSGVGIGGAEPEMSRAGPRVRDVLCGAGRRSCS
jgi:hypothetical protein